MPLTASCLTNVQVRIPPGLSEKVASDFVLGGGFRRLLQFPPSVTTGWSRRGRNLPEKVTKNEIPNYLLYLPTVHSYLLYEKYRLLPRYANVNFLNNYMYINLT